MIAKIVMPKAHTPQRAHSNLPVLRLGEQCIDLSDGVGKLLAATQLLEMCWPLIVACGSEPASDFETKVIPHSTLEHHSSPKSST